jgi:hypothetical protein
MKIKGKCPGRRLRHDEDNKLGRCQAGQENMGGNRSSSFGKTGRETAREAWLLGTITLNDYILEESF